MSNIIIPDLYPIMALAIDTSPSTLTIVALGLILLAFSIIKDNAGH